MLRVAPYCKDDKQNNELQSTFHSCSVFIWFYVVNGTTWNNSVIWNYRISCILTLVSTKLHQSHKYHINTQHTTFPNGSMNIKNRLNRKCFLQSRITHEIEEIREYRVCITGSSNSCHNVFTMVTVIRECIISPTSILVGFHKTFIPVVGFISSILPRLFLFTGSWQVGYLTIE